MRLMAGVAAKKRHCEGNNGVGASTETAEAQMMSRRIGQSEFAGRATGATGDGVLFLGTGASAALPQLCHLRLLGNPAHPLFKLSKISRSRSTLLEDFDPSDEGRGVDEASPVRKSISSPTDPLPATQGKDPEDEGERNVALIRRCLEEAEVKHRSECCPACLDGWLRPHASPNRRNNVSILVRCDDGTKNILIDCGKTFRDAALNLFPRHMVTELNALVLTHEHQDAMGGLDDIRDFQLYSRPVIKCSTSAERQPSGVPLTSSNASQKSSEAQEVVGISGSTGSLNSSADLRRGYSATQRLPTFLTPFTLFSMTTKFQYIVDASVGTQCQNRKVAQLEFHLLEDPLVPSFHATNQLPNASDSFSSPSRTTEEAVTSSSVRETTNGILSSDGWKAVDQHSAGPNFCSKALFQRAMVSAQRCPVNSCGYTRLKIPGVEHFEMIALPVWHGQDYRAMGFVFGWPDRVAYFSDVSEFDPSVLHYLQNSLKPVKVLILDALMKERNHFSHFNLLQGLEIVKLLEPMEAYFVGMSCELEHYETSRFLEGWLEEYSKDWRRQRSANGCEADEEPPVRSVKLARDGLFLSLSLSEPSRCVSPPS